MRGILRRPSRRRSGRLRERVPQTAADRPHPEPFRCAVASEQRGDPRSTRPTSRQRRAVRRCPGDPWNQGTRSGVADRDRRGADHLHVGLDGVTERGDTLAREPLGGDACGGRVPRDRGDRPDREPPPFQLRLRAQSAVVCRRHGRVVGDRALSDRSTDRANPPRTRCLGRGSGSSALDAAPRCRLVPWRTDAVAPSHDEHGGTAPGGGRSYVEAIATPRGSVPDVRADGGVPELLPRSDSSGPETRIASVVRSPVPNSSFSETTIRSAIQVRSGSSCIGAQPSRSGIGTTRNLQLPSSAHTLAVRGARRTRSGWCSPATCVRRDEEGDLFFVGRRDTLIKTLGFRVSPDEVVDVLYASGEVVEAVVAAEPDEPKGQRIVAFVVLTESGSARASHRVSARRNSLVTCSPPASRSETPSADTQREVRRHDDRDLYLQRMIPADLRDSLAALERFEAIRAKRGARSARSSVIWRTRTHIRGARERCTFRDPGGAG